MRERGACCEATDVSRERSGQLQIIGREASKVCLRRQRQGTDRGNALLDLRIRELYTARPATRYNNAATIYLPSRMRFCRFCEVSRRMLLSTLPFPDQFRNPH